jgi:hypothetical protein
VSLYHNFDYFCLCLLGDVWLLSVVSSYFCGLPHIAVNGKRKNPFCAPLRPKGHKCNGGSLHLQGGWAQNLRPRWHGGAMPTLPRLPWDATPSKYSGGASHGRRFRFGSASPLPPLRRLRRRTPFPMQKTIRTGLQHWFQCSEHFAVNGKRENPFRAPLRPKGHICNKGSLS